MSGPSHGPVILHGSAVCVGSAAVLITGKSGTGKSTLALQLIGLGATLVSDDQVIATPRENGLWLAAPEPIRDKIEARNFGLLACPARPGWVRAVIDLNEIETRRLPKPRETVIAGVLLPTFRKVESPAFATMLIIYLQGGLTS